MANDLETLIYIVPFIIIFLFIFIQIFLFFKKIFNFVFKNLSEHKETLSQSFERAGRRSSEKGSNYERQKLEMPEKDYIPITEREFSEEDLRKQKSEYAEDSRQQKMAYDYLSSGEKDEKKSQRRAEHSNSDKDSEDYKKKKRRKDSHIILGVNSKDYSELEKAVLYKEILDKPKALKN